MACAARCLAGKRCFDGAQARPVVLVAHLMELLHSRRCIELSLGVATALSWLIDKLGPNLLVQGTFYSIVKVHFHCP